MFNTISEDYENVFYFLIDAWGINWFVKMVLCAFYGYILHIDQLSQDKVRFLESFLI